MELALHTSGQVVQEFIWKRDEQLQLLEPQLGPFICPTERNRLLSSRTKLMLVHDSWRVLARRIHVALL